MTSPTYIAATSSQDIASKDAAAVARWVDRQLYEGVRIIAYVRMGPERPGCSTAAPREVIYGGVSRMTEWFRQTSSQWNSGET